MKLFLSIIFIITFDVCYSQELDIFQDDSIYRKNKISTRTMFQLNRDMLQKEIVTYYNLKGQKVKQFWFRNWDKEYNNVETFIYSENGLLINIIDSSREKDIETTTFYYNLDKTPQKRVSIKKTDTSEFRIYPDRLTTIKYWYSSGKPYRIDTTVFEKENVKLEYFGFDQSLRSYNACEWHYRYKNHFDGKGNLIKASTKTGKSQKSIITYTYDDRGLLVSKYEAGFTRRRQMIGMRYYFAYE